MNHLKGYNTDTQHNVVCPVAALQPQAANHRRTWRPCSAPTRSSQAARPRSHAVARWPAVSEERPALPGDAPGDRVPGRAETGAQLTQLTTTLLADEHEPLLGDMARSSVRPWWGSQHFPVAWPPPLPPGPSSRQEVALPWRNTESWEGKALGRRGKREAGLGWPGE